MSERTTPPSVDDLETEIALTRAELARTADELAARLDPRRQAAEAADNAKRLVRDAVGTDPAADPTNRNRSRTILAVGVGIAALTVALLIRRR